MIFLLGSGLAAGFIDSMIGGGGLISVPALMLFMGIGPAAIGTNKVAAVACTFTATAIYFRHGHVNWKTAIPFAISVGIGSTIGAWVSPAILVPFYRPLLIAGAGLCLATILFKERLLAVKHKVKSADPVTIIALGLLCGFYDGAWGPGGGTFMFLAMAFATPLSIVGAIGASKVANSTSALLSLMTYGMQGLVNWKLGAIFAVSLAAGAVAGANLGIKHAERILTPLLALIGGLLLWKLIL